jgi:alkanesulfonate monooxygenase SsuD/methylene tetrahydromethanopterin reductase-like flavin-dependent oxidoreductase (luciferase family)
VISHHGEYYDFPAVRFEPKPFQRPIPIEVGGTSPAALRRAGRLGDGWIELGSRDADEFAGRLAVVRQARAEAGRAELPFVVTSGIGAAATPDDVEQLTERGVDRAIFGLAGTTSGRDLGEMSEALARFADAVVRPGA